MADITVEHEGHEIDYYEHDNTWRWDKKAFDSLALARKAIDKAMSEARKVDVPALIYRNGGWKDPEGFEPVTVTSLDVDGISAWIRTADKSRRKERRDNLFAVSTANASKMERYLAASKEILRLSKGKQSLMDSMDRVQLASISGVRSRLESSEDE